MRAQDPFGDSELLVRRVYAYVAYRIGDGSDAEDITSDAFERALRYRDSFDPRRGDVASWLIGIARRCIADAALSRLATAAELPDQIALDGFEGQVVERAELRRAVVTLDERSRELIALRYGGDLTAKQIGELLDMKTNAVEVALHRALNTLRAALEPPAAEGAPSGTTTRLEWASRPQP